MKAGAWYACSGSKVRELFTIMHLPYTSMVLSYVLIGAAISPSIYLNRVTFTLVAYFLGLGLSAHALNELHARHWGDTLSRRDLEILCAVPLIVSLLIGVYGMVTLFMISGTLLAPFSLLVLIFLETFFLFAYNTDFAHGRFHSDLSFSFSWGALPTIISYYVNALTFTPTIIPVAIAIAATAGIEINLSRWCKEFRRKSSLTEMTFADSNTMKLSTAELIARPEKALKLIVVAVDLIAVGLILLRLLV